MESYELFLPEETGGIAPEGVFDAYFECRRGKRGTYDALAFEADYERKCLDLWREINSGTYQPSVSAAFVFFHSVARIAFAIGIEKTGKQATR